MIGGVASNILEILSFRLFSQRLRITTIAVDRKPKVLWAGTRA
jgi:hypothetical protein